MTVSYDDISLKPQGLLSQELMIHVLKKDVGNSVEFKNELSEPGKVSTFI